MPPPIFRFKVGGTPARQEFLDTERRCSERIIELMQQAGKPLSSPGTQHILDFGCGCGRTLMWLAREFPEKNYYGTDTDAEMIDWCKRHLGFARFSLNRPMPPASLGRLQFDLIYAISVFTHLDENAQMAWLPQLERSLSAGGRLLLTVHGEAAWSHLAPEQQLEIRRRGITTTISSKLEGFFPNWYQTTFHTEEYVRRTFSKFLTVSDYLPEGMGYLDVVVCSRLENSPG